MMLIIYLLISILCFCHYSGNENNLKNTSNKNSTAEANEIIVNNDQENIHTSNKKGDLKVNVYENKQLVSTYIYYKNVLQEVTYPDQRNDDEEIGQKGLKDFVDKIEARDRASYKFLRSKNIKMPYPELIFNEIRDTVTVLDMIRFGNDNSKKETKKVGSRKIIKRLNIDGYVTFYPSPLDYVSRDEKLEDYELTLKNSYLEKEVYKFEKSKFSKQYFYNQNKLVKLIYTSVIQGEQEIKETRFEYQRLN